MQPAAAKEEQALIFMRFSVLYCGLLLNIFLINTALSKLYQNS